MNKKQRIKYRSQCGQDKWVIEDIFRFKKNGFFLELGAGDGIFLSNTYILEKDYDLKGICIEANKDLFRKLKENRKCICDNSCIDSKKQKVKFTKNKGLHGGIIDNDLDNKIDDVFVFRTTVTLKDILKKYNAPKVIDYFSLDVEGAETRILKNFPFNEYIFLAINIERPSKLLREILKKNGYIFVGRNVHDELYLYKNFFKTLSIKKKMKLFFVYIIYNARSIIRILRSYKLFGKGQ